MLTIQLQVLRREKKDLIQIKNSLSSYADMQDVKYAWLEEQLLDKGMSASEALERVNWHGGEINKYGDLYDESESGSESDMDIDE